MVTTQHPLTCLPANHSGGSGGGGGRGGWRVCGNVGQRPRRLEKLVVELGAGFEGLLKGVRANAVVCLGLSWGRGGGGRF